MAYLFGRGFDSLQLHKITFATFRKFSKPLFHKGFFVFITSIFFVFFLTLHLFPNKAMPHSAT